MSTLSIRLQYHLLALRRDQFWLPAGLTALFGLLAFLFRNDSRAFDIAGGFLGIVLPLVSGLMAAGIVVDDPVLELQFATPRSPGRVLVERLLVLWLIVALFAGIYQLWVALLGINLDALGSPAARQLAWFVPALGLMGLTSMAASAFASSTLAAMVGGFVWLLELLLRDWFAISDWARYLFLFLRVRDPTHPSLALNEVTILALGCLMFVAAARLLEREERYIG